MKEQVDNKCANDDESFGLVEKRMEKQRYGGEKRVVYRTTEDWRGPLRIAPPLPPVVMA